MSIIIEEVLLKVKEPNNWKTQEQVWKIFFNPCFIILSVFTTLESPCEPPELFTYLKSH